MQSFLQDVRYGMRQLFQQPGSSLVAVLTLALGIGVSSALFSVIDATMLRPLPYPHPEQLVSVYSELVEANGSNYRPTPSMEDMRTWQAADDVFSIVAGWGSAFRGRIIDGPEPQRIEVMQFTEDYLPMYGVVPVIGRNFTRDDCELQSPLVALLGYGFWQTHFGGNRDVLGATIRLDNAVATVIGVLPAWFNRTTPISTPLRIAPAELARRGTGRVSVEARLRPGISLDDAAVRLSPRMPPPTGAGEQVRTRLASRLESTLSGYRTTINVFIGAVALIVLLAGVNLAGLLLARGAARQRELDVRASLGASRTRLVQQLLTESVVLAVPAGMIGVALAWVSLDAIVANIPLSMPSNSPVTLNLSVLVLTLAALLAITVVFGLVPAIRLSRANAGRVMVRSSRHVGSALSRRGGQLLIGAEIALAVLLVAGAGLMLRSYLRMSAVDLGFNSDDLITMQVMPLVSEPPAHKHYYEALLPQLRTLPGVASAALVDNFALGSGTSFTGVKSAESAEVFAQVFATSPGYLETLGASLRAGRLMNDADYASQSRVVVINESAARLLFNSEGGIGREVTRSGSQQPWTVVGVIADLRHGGPLNTRQDSRSQVFFPFEPTKGAVTSPMTIVLRLSRPAPGLTEQMRRVAQSIGPRVVVEKVLTADALFNERVITPRRRLVLLGLLGSLGLVLALVGVFGTTAYAVTRRTAEIGLRLAIGARPAQVVGTIVHDSAVPIVVGTIVGVAAAALMSRAIESFLFQTSPTDPTTLAGVAAVLIAAGSIAALVPAIRAAQVDPSMTLRAE
jgi:putative ABC transport system permease protein